MNSSTTAGISKVPSYQTKISSVYEDLFDVLVTFDGTFKTEDFRLQLPLLSRETVLQDLDFSILNYETSQQKSNIFIDPNLDGFLGIAPYPRKAAAANGGNFLYQLEHIQEYIDNSVVMFNIDLALGNSSIVKFGGYEESALKGEMNIYNTTTSDQWMLTAKGFTFGSD